MIFSPQLHQASVLVKQKIPLGCRASQTEQKCLVSTAKDNSFRSEVIISLLSATTLRSQTILTHIFVQDLLRPYFNKNCLFHKSAGKPSSPVGRKRCWCSFLLHHMLSLSLVWSIYLFLLGNCCFVCGVRCLVRGCAVLKTESQHKSSMEFTEREEEQSSIWLGRR